MAIKIHADTTKHLINSIQRFFAENMDDEIGDLKAQLLLDFVIREIGPSIYNQAIADAQVYFHDKVEDLGGVKYEAEFDYWKK
jgi:uncharacterized protein (DUF2164 family)